MQSILVSTVALALFAAPARAQDAETPRRATRCPTTRRRSCLHAVSRRLQGLMFAVQAGGRESMDRLLAAANANLVAREPELAPLGLADVTHVGRAQDGTVTVRLVHRADEGGHLVVTVTAPAEGEPSVEMRRTR